MASNKTSTGVTYVNNANTVEYQLFPEEYFSGCDITIYFGDIFVSEISGLQFELQEKVNPIYSYASRTYDTVARGSRIVTGSFKIPFREAGYIESIMSHIAQADNGSIPEIAYKMAGTTGPAWIADTKETIDHYLDNKSIGYDEKTITDDNSIFPGHYPIVPGDKGEHVKEIRRLMEKAAANGNLGSYNDDVFNTKAANNEVVQYFADHGSWSAEAIKEYAETWSDDAYQTGSSGQYTQSNYVLPIQHRLAQMSEGSSSSVEYKYLNDKYFGRFTSKCAIEIAEAFSRPGDGTALREAYEEMKASADANGGTNNWTGLDHVTSVKPAGFLIELASVHESDEDLNRYAADMYRAALYIKSAAGDAVTDAWATIREKGTLTETDIKKLYELAGESYTESHTEKEKAVQAGIGAETRYSKYEKEVWGRSFSQDLDHKYQTFFYTDRERTDGTNVQEKLKKLGFDVYITYGPSPEAIENNNWQLPSSFSFNTTVKAIRKMQLTSTGQTIMVNGQPIEELYTFIAQDLD